MGIYNNYTQPFNTHNQWFNHTEENILHYMKDRIRQYHQNPNTLQDKATDIYYMGLEIKAKRGEINRTQDTTETFNRTKFDITHYENMTNQ